MAKMICDLCGANLVAAVALLHRAECLESRRTDDTVELLREIDEAMTSVSQRMRGLAEDYERVAKLLEEP